MPSRRGFLATALALLLATWLPGPAGAQSWRTVTVSRQKSGESDMRVRIRYGAGRMKIQPAEEGALYRMELRYDEEAFEPVADFHGNHLELGVKSIRKNINWPGKQDGGEMDLSLARRVPMDLDLEFGAVRADLDLGGLDITRMDLSTGASESRVDISEPNGVPMSSAEFEVGAADFHVRNLGNLNAKSITVDAGVGSVVLDFRGRWQRDANVSVDMGLGSLELRFPEGLGVRVGKNTFLTSLDSEGLVKRGDSYYSLDWDEAQYRVTVSVDAVLGGIDVVWIR